MPETRATTATLASIKRHRVKHHAQPAIAHVLLAATTTAVAVRKQAHVRHVLQGNTKPRTELQAAHNVQVECSSPFVVRSAAGHAQPARINPAQESHRAWSATQHAQQVITTLLVAQKSEPARHVRLDILSRRAQASCATAALVVRSAPARLGSAPSVTATYLARRSRFDSMQAHITVLILTVSCRRQLLSRIVSAHLTQSVRPISGKQHQVRRSSTVFALPTTCLASEYESTGETPTSDCACTAYGGKRPKIGIPIRSSHNDKRVSASSLRFAIRAHSTRQKRRVPSTIASAQR